MFSSNRSYSGYTFYSTANKNIIGRNVSAYFNLSDYGEVHFIFVYCSKANIYFMLFGMLVSFNFAQHIIIWSASSIGHDEYNSNYQTFRKLFGELL